MEMIPRGDNFRLIIDSQDLVRGMRTTKRAPRNSGYLTRSMGAVGRDGVLQTLDQMNALDLSAITDDFPYPQIFVFPMVTIVCGETKIYEWISNALVLKLTVSAGALWDGEASGEYVYISNGKVSVIRDPVDLTYALSDLPRASSICNFNGQFIIGAPEEDSTT